jgi:hypothetical protein
VPLLRVLGEGAVAEYFTPTAGDVYDGIDREAERIGWKTMTLEGIVTSIERIPTGGYEVSYRSGESRRSLSALHVHLALGYVGPRIDPVIAECRSRMERGGEVVVHSYEPHEHLYALLAIRGGRVLVRGAGITAAQILHRLDVERCASGKDVRVLHVVRDLPDFVEASEWPPGSRRRLNGFLNQHFVFPRAAGGGQLAKPLEAMEPDRRARTVARLGTPTSPRRAAWERALEVGRRQGWYEVEAATLENLEPASGGGLEATLRLEGGKVVQERVDCLIDATGLECGVAEHPLLSSMAGSGLVAVNPLGRLAVDASFAADRHPAGGVLYASGPVTLGGPVAPVDSFWGLTEAAWRIVGELSVRGDLRRITPARSIAAWWRWARGSAP